MALYRASPVRDFENKNPARQMADGMIWVAEKERAERKVTP
jgi:hypothetical protein